jgi:hypothetical protein
MQRRLVGFLWLVLLLGSLGCVNMRAIPYETVSREPKPKDYSMEIVESGNSKRPFKVIGMVQANAGRLHRVSDTLERLRVEARKMGGDALMDLQQGPAQTGAATSGPFASYRLDDNVREIWTAKVIVWLDQSPDNESQ